MAFFLRKHFLFILILSILSSALFLNRGFFVSQNRQVIACEESEEDETPTLCTTEGHENLTGSIDDSGHGAVTNSSENCIHKVGLASYQMFDQNIDNQVIFQSDKAEIQPGETLALSIGVPSCAYQIDLFQGDVLGSLAGGVRYGSRLITSRVFVAPPPYCFVPTPTPTQEPSLTPTPTETPAPTATPTPTPTSAPNELPECLGFSGSPTSGGATLNVNFTGSGDDDDGKIMAFEFNFGDGQKKVVEGDFGGSASQSVSHPYGQPGTYNASLRVKDNNGDWSETGDSCKVKIKVEGEVLSAPAIQPKTGSPTILALSFLFSGVTGLVIKRAIHFV